MIAARAFRAALVFGLVAFPNLCLACPACVDPRESNRWAFLSMTIFMSLLPLGMFGGLVLWWRRRVKSAEAASRPLHAPAELPSSGE